MYVITLSGECYYIIRQEEFITLSGKTYYIIRQQVYYIIGWFYYIIIGSCYINKRVLHYRL